jgi:hypothetical protein
MHHNAWVSIPMGNESESNPIGYGPGARSSLFIAVSLLRACFGSSLRPWHQSQDSKQQPTWKERKASGIG